MFQVGYLDNIEKHEVTPPSRDNQPANFIIVFQCVYLQNKIGFTCYILLCICFIFFIVSAVYDCTLNFRNNENPTLLGVLNGKKYHADLYVR